MASLEIPHSSSVGRIRNTALRTAVNNIELLRACLACTFCAAVHWAAGWAASTLGASMGDETEWPACEQATHTSEHMYRNRILPAGPRRTQLHRNHRPTKREAWTAMTSRVSLIKDSMDVILKSFILSLFVSATLLWSYLHSINAKSLFLDAISSKEGLAAVLFVAVLMLVAFFFQMWMPSLVVVAASSMANGKLDEATDRPARYFLYVFAIWLVLLVAMSMSFEGGWVIFAVLGGTYVTATVLFLVRQGKKEQRWSMFSLGMPAAATFAAMVTALPMSMFGNVLGPNAHTGDKAIEFFFTIAVSSCGYLPSLFYLNAQRWAKNLISRRCTFSLERLCPSSSW